jgi:hypothetical protein
VTTKTKQPAADDRVDVHVPDTEVMRELGVSHMTIFRYDNDPTMIALGWPPPIRLGLKGQRKFRSRKLLDAFKAAMLRRAFEERRKYLAKRGGAAA